MQNKITFLWLLFSFLLLVGCQKESIEPESTDDRIIKGDWKINTTAPNYIVKGLSFQNETYTEQYKEAESDPFDYKIKQVGKDSYLVRWNKYSAEWQTIARFEIRHVVFLYLYYPSRSKPIIFQRE